MLAEYFEVFLRGSPDLLHVLMNTSTDLAQPPRLFAFSCVDKVEQTLMGLIFGGDIDFSEYFVEYSQPATTAAKTRRLSLGGTVNVRSTSFGSSIQTGRSSTARGPSRARVHTHPPTPSSRPSHEHTTPQQMSIYDQFSHATERYIGLRMAVPATLQQVVHRFIELMGISRIDWSIGDDDDEDDDCNNDNNTTNADASPLSSYEPEDSDEMTSGMSSLSTPLGEMSEDYFFDQQRRAMQLTKECSVSTPAGDSKLFFIETPSTSPTPSRVVSQFDMRALEAADDLPPLPAALITVPRRTIDLGF